MSPPRDSRHWGDPMRTGSAFDFRSDTISTPSLGMLSAISRATLNDDVYGEERTTIEFERHIAAICGKEASALVMSGTMANQLALRALLQQPPHAVLADAHAHVVHFEAGGLALISGAMVQAIRPSNDRHLTLADIQNHAVISDQLEKCPTRAVTIENTAHGNVVPLDDLRRIKNWAAANRIAVHIDGARLWNAVATGAGTLKEFASCYNALTLCFMKGTGAPMGAMVVGSQDLVNKVRRLRQSIGGGVGQIGMIAAAAHQAVLENFGPGEVDIRGVLKSAHDLAKMMGEWWTWLLLRPTETNMVWLDLENAEVTAEVLSAAGKANGVLVSGKRIVFRHQICDAALSGLKDVLSEILHRKKSVTSEPGLVVSRL